MEIRAERRLKLTSCHCMPKRWTTEEAVKAEKRGRSRRGGSLETETHLLVLIFTQGETCTDTASPLS